MKDKLITTKLNIGQLRQWLNEKPADRLVTNEDIEYWLFGVEPEEQIKHQSQNPY